MPLVLGGTIEGEQQLSRRLLNLENNLEDFSQPLSKIGSNMLQTFDANFASRGGVFGSWAPRKGNFPWPILERSGALRAGFDKRVERDMVTLFNPIDYFPYHQSNQPRQKIPRRVMMKIDQERKEMIQKAFQAYIIASMRKTNV